MELNKILLICGLCLGLVATILVVNNIINYKSNMETFEEIQESTDRMQQVMKKQLDWIEDYKNSYNCKNLSLQTYGGSS